MKIETFKLIIDLIFTISVIALCVIDLKIGILVTIMVVTGDIKNLLNK